MLWLKEAAAVVSNNAGTIATANGTSFSCPIMAGMSCVFMAGFSNKNE